MEKTNNTLTVTFTNLPDGLIDGIKKICDENPKEVAGVKLFTSPDTNSFTIDTRFMDQKAEILAGIFTEYARSLFKENLFKKISSNI